ncbi:TIGR02281 family clan AA aspartic protease [Mesorhizobium sp. NBSH29]|uniref:TIGR02281 family clan AA aspartic protease n=1 Tax=Mesorhizobium sp. NBSH29 TaxID=2654249 RepID=UPI0018968BF6|nr:TIGR02281 family clan AA aspartic protease [Mesorhizobium sp. NBSH29]QPC88007.1 TIGR02281 family clan AA aspartic protease [Mesorhizobium sp. NBSH29]
MKSLFWFVFAIAAVALATIMLTGTDIIGISGEEIGRTAYIALWSAFVAVGILSSGQRFGTVLRSLALRALLILVFIAGYQYRYELQDVASRITVGLVPGSPLSLTDSNGKQTVELEKLPSGHFGVRAKVDTTSVDFMVDTGATTTVLTLNDARRAGIDPNRLSFSVSVSTANGTGRAARAIADEVAVGSIVRRRVPVLVAEAHALEQSLLGMNFLGTLSGYDVRGDRMILRD